jgi:hypothetical protein
VLEARPVPIVPAYIGGTRAILAPGKRLPRLRRATVRFGRPLDAAAIAPGAIGRAHHQRVVDTIRAAVAALADAEGAAGQRRGSDLEGEPNVESPEKKSAPAPATAPQIVEIIGPLEAAALTGILATGATQAEVLVAFAHFSAADALDRRIAPPLDTAARRVFDILSTEFEPPEER